MLGVDPTTTWRPHVRWAGGLAPVWVRLVFRTLFLGSQVLFAEVFLSGTGDIILDVQALTGSVGMAGMTFFLPSVLALALLPRELGCFERCWCHVNFWIGVCVMVGLGASRPPRLHRMLDLCFFNTLRSIFYRSSSLMLHSTVFVPTL